MTELLNNELILLTAILALGTLLGRLEIQSIQLSASGGVLFVALVFGHFGYHLPQTYSTLGFAFFIYAIGFSAGPRFFQSFRANGLRYAAIALFVAAVACAVAIPLILLFDLPFVLLPGILGGALTSTSTLAAAYEIAQDPNMSVAYGVTYPFGLLGLLILIQMITRRSTIDLEKEAERVKLPDLEDEEEESELFQKRVFQVQNIGIVETPLRELNLRELSGVGIITVKHGDKTQLATADTTLHLHDHIVAEGPLKLLLELEELVGPEIEDKDLLERENVTAQVVITNKEFINSTIQELRLPRDFRILVTRLRRGAVYLSVRPSITLERGDVLTLTGEKERLDHVIAMLGYRESKKYQTDIFMFCLGLLSGVLIGTVKLPLINASIGNAGGLLCSGILVGYFRHYGYYSGKMPPAARYILQETGLLLFLATIGLQAGGGLVAQLAESGIEIFITGAAVTTITIISSLGFSHYIMKFDWNTSFGAMTGGVTSTVALKLITEKAGSQYALLGYAGVYAFSNILLTVLGQVLVQAPRL